jgi:glycosyltransferase involved in cell wall biosynthesis
MIIELEKFNGYIYIHMTHYYLNPSKLSSVISRLKKPVLLSEGSLNQNEFFQFHFKSSIDHIQIPLVSDKRFFSASVANDSRKLKCLVVGSLPRIYNADFCNYFGEMNYLHPMRKILYENQELLKNELVCHGRFVGSVEPEPSQNQTSAGEKFFVYDQFDIVEEFRNYWMFISPEEIIGLPSVNFIDGMLSGSAFLGASNQIYAGYGMIPGVHYISYSAEDLKDLVKTIKYYQNNPSELETIASAGQKFVQDNFSEQQVVSKLNKIFEK